MKKRFLDWIKIVNIQGQLFKFIDGLNDKAFFKLVFNLGQMLKMGYLYIKIGLMK